MSEKIIKVLLVAAAFVLAFMIFFRIDLIHRGGPLMIPLIVVSIFSFAIIVAKIKQFSEERLDMEGFLKKVFEEIERQRIREAVELCDKAKGPAARMLKAGIMKYDRPKDEIKEAMESALFFEMPLLEKNLYLLSAFSEIAPLLGLLAVLTGLMKILLVIEAKAASLAPVVSADLLPGIWEAVLCSIAGFLVAIPVLLAHHYLAHRVRMMHSEMEQGAAELLNFLLERRMSL